MSTLLYSPGVKVVVETARHGLIDVSDDLASGSLTRHENQVSTFQFNLVNSRRKYDGLFTPNDRVTVQMKRIRWLQVFAGYLDTVPYFSAFSREVPLSASCTLKRLQYRFWDPGTNAAHTLMFGTPEDNNEPDMGMKARAIRLLTQVARWPEETIHIGMIPQDWQERATRLKESLAEDFAVSSDLVGPGPTVGGQSTGAVGTGEYGFIVDAASAAGWSGESLVEAVAVALAESSGDPNARSDPNSDGSRDHGLWQINDKYQSWAFSGDGARRIYEPGYNATVARRIYEERGRATPGRPWAAWYAHTPRGKPYGSGERYQAALPKARAAITGQRGYVAHLPGARGSDTPNPGEDGYYSVLPGTTSAGTGAADSEAEPHVRTFLGLCQAQAGDRYQLGDGRNLENKDPTSFDCSGLIYWALGQMGVRYAGTSHDQWARCKADGTLIPVETAVRTAGALLFVEKGAGAGGGGGNHVAVSLGNGQTIEARGRRYGVGNWSSTEGRAWTHGGLIKPLNGYGNVEIPSGWSGGESLTSGLGSQDGLLTIWWAGAEPNAISNALYGPRALMNDTPMLPNVAQLMQASMRSFCSAPNGDFIAWFPDYFGLYGLAGRMVIRPIELQDFSIMWSDQHLVTHQFVVGAMYRLNPSPDPSQGGPIDALAQFTTQGIASVEFPQIMEALFNIPPDHTSGWANPQQLLARFGARPNFQGMNLISGGDQEFWAALYLFQRNWARQFSARIPLTFMPELFPGMLVQIPDPYGFQAYVESVTHDFSFADGAGFSTSVAVTAPSAMDGSGLYGLPKGGRMTEEEQAYWSDRGTPGGGGGATARPL